MLSEYRQRLELCHTDLHREDYLYRSGRKTGRETTFIYREYSDLFSLSVIDELRGALKETSASRETELASIGRLIAIAVEGNLAGRVRDISEEIEAYERAAEIEWSGKRIGFKLSGEIMTSEPDASTRREFYFRRADLVKRGQDLRAELFERIDQGARDLGFESYLAMNRQLRGIDAERLAGQVTPLLSATESRYLSTLGPLLARQAGTSIDEATPADLVYLERFARFDHFFPRNRLTEIYRELFAGLGFSTDKQVNVELDALVSYRQQARSFCSPIQVPDEIKLAFNLKDGQSSYREFLREAGRAQSFAWTSRHLYPEFRIQGDGGDGALPAAWGLLFENLMLDEVWLAERIGLLESEEFRYTLAVCRLMEARRNAAKLNYEVDFHAGQARKMSGAPGERYVELMTEALRVRFDEAEHLEALKEPFSPAVFMRAAAFELPMREYLKTRFGRRWWTSRKAGEMLIDLWNTGQRHTVEELASMIGLGEPDYTGLAVDLLQQIER